MEAYGGRHLKETTPVISWTDHYYTDPPPLKLYTRVKSLMSISSIVSLWPLSPHTTTCPLYEIIYRRWPRTCRVRVYVGDMSTSNGGAHAVRAEWGHVPSMSYVSNFASILRKKTRNCVAFEPPPFPNQRYPRSRKRENTRHCPCVFADAFNVLLTRKVIPQLRVLFRPPAVGLHGIVPTGVLRAERTALETVWE